MQSFFILFNRYLAETAKNEKMCVDRRLVASAPRLARSLTDPVTCHMMQRLGEDPAADA